MKNLNDLLLLGDPILYRVSEPVTEHEADLVDGWVADLHQVMEEVRKRYGLGRAIAAPQLGILKMIIYVNITEPVVIINPVFTFLSEEMIEVWDDCMCLPELLVKVRRHKKVIMRYLDRDWNEHDWHAEDDVSELLQHEYDHLDGILCTMRAIDNKSFRWKRKK